MHDRDIVMLYFNRNEKAISETISKYSTYCMSIAYGILLNEQDAEECVNDTYLRVWNSIPPAQPHSLKAYVGTIVRRLAINKYKREHTAKRNKDLEIAFEELSDCVPIPDDNVEGLPALLDEFLGSLSETDLRLFMRRYWYSVLPTELAKQEGMTVNAVTVRLYKIRNRLHSFLKERGYMP